MGGQILISHDPQDAETAAYLANDLARQGAPVGLQPGGNEQAVDEAAALVALVSQASTASDQVWADADRAARAGKPIYVARLGDVSAQAYAPMPVRSWTDAFGPNAQANVARLGEELRTVASRSAPAWGGQPHAPNPYGSPAPGSRSGRPPMWLTIGGSVLGAIVIVVGLLEITEAINIFDSGSSSSSTSYSSSTNTSSIGNMSGGTMGGEAMSMTPPLTEAYLLGTWRPDCSSTDRRAVIFTSPSLISAGGSPYASYTLTSSGLSVRENNGTTTSMSIVPLSQSSMSAAVQGRTQILTRCSAM